MRDCDVIEIGAITGIKGIQMGSERSDTRDLLSSNFILTVNFHHYYYIKLNNFYFVTTAMCPNAHYLVKLMLRDKF